MKCIELKSFHHQAKQSEETIAYTAVLWMDGKKLGPVSNDGKGGCARLQFHPEDQALFRDYCATLPPVPDPFGGEPMVMSWDFYLDLLAGKMVDRARLQRLHKAGKTVFTLQGEPDTEWSFNRPYSLEVAEQLAAKYPDLKEILNPRLEKPVTVYEEP